jgi:phage tail sheath protein FI
MPASYVSPGLYVREIDESLFVPALADTPFGVVGFATWGPIAGDPDDTVTAPTLVTSAGQLSKAFGPNTGVPVDSYSDGTDEYPTHPMLYAASRYLRSGRRCYVARVADLATAAKAIGYLKGTPTNVAPPLTNTSNPINVPNPTTAQGITTGTAGTGGFLPPDTTFQFAITFNDGAGGETTIGTTEVSETTSSTPTDDTHKLTFEFTGTWLTNTSTGAELPSANIYMRQAGGTYGLLAANQTKAQMEAIRDVTTLPFDTSSNVYKVWAKYKGTLGNRIKVGVAPGGDTSVTKPTKKYTVSLQSPVTSSIVSQVEIFDGVASNPYDKNSDGTSNDVLKRITVNNSDFIYLDLISAPTSNTALNSSNTLISDPTEGSGNNFTASATNGIGLFEGNAPTDGSTTKNGYVRVGISFTGVNGGETLVATNANPIQVTSNWTTSGAYVSGNGDITVQVEAGAVSATDVSHVNIYLSKEIASTDTEATITDLRLTRSIPVSQWGDTNVANTSWVLSRLPGQQLPANTNTVTGISLSGGLDGLPSTSATTAEKDALYIGKVKDAVQEASGLQIFRDTETTDISLLAVPGVSTASVVTTLIDVAEKRGDCVALVDPPSKGGPDGAGTGGIKSADGVIKWHNGVSGLVDAPTTSLNSSYAALFWPWVQIMDGLNSQKLYIPPSGIAAEVFAQSDYASEQWFAPAGLNRGTVKNILQAQFRPTLGERDAMYSQGNAINPIATFRGSGVVVWGQRTLQRLPTALDRINVRRLLIFLRRVIDRAAVGLVFEQNDSTMWRKFNNIVSPILDGVKARRGIVDYRVVMDETTNTPDIIEQNQAVGDIFIKPTKTAEIIILNFIVTSQTSDFTETTTTGSL